MALPFFGRKPSAGGASPEAPAGVASPPPTELTELDFTGDDGGRSLVLAAGKVEVQEGGAGIGAVFEEAAVLYANGNDTEAERILVAVLGDRQATSGEGLWMMLLDLYRLTGQQQRFDAHVLDYATRFERSPPPWVDLSAADAAAAPAPAPLVNLAGSLSSQAAAQCQQIIRLGRHGGAVRIDLARLRDIDDAGCGLLRRTLAGLAAERVQVSLLNVAALTEVLAQRLAPGRAEARDSWLMLLELLQYAGDPARFEALAIDYAVTFEESPPSWEGRGAPVARAAAEETVAAATVAAARPAGDVFHLEGELGGASSELLRRLAAFAAERAAVRVDCARLRRLDFVCAGMLFNILSTLRAQGKLVSLCNVNAMVAALLRVMSVDQVAHVTLRH